MQDIFGRSQVSAAERRAKGLEEESARAQKELAQVRTELAQARARRGHVLGRSMVCRVFLGSFLCLRAALPPHFPASAMALFGWSNSAVATLSFRSHSLRLIFF